MAVKANKEECTELSVANLDAQTGFNPLANLVEPERSSFLPIIKLPYGVEMLEIPLLDEKGEQVVIKGKPQMESAAGKLVVSNGKRIEPIRAPYTLVTFTIRGATRKLVEKDGKKIYERTYADFRGKNDSDAHKAAMAAAANPQSGVVAGNVALVIVLPSDNKASAVVGLMEMFRTQTKYWTPVLQQGLLFNKNGVVINVDDHSQNMTVSAGGHKYYSYSKFNQWQQINLSKEQEQQVREALKANSKACDEWLYKQ